MLNIFKKIPMLPVFVILVVWLSSSLALPPHLQSRDNYDKARNELVETDRHFRIKYDENLNDKELKADSILKALKAPYLELPKFQFPPAHRFHLVKKYYDESPLLVVMDKLPKGGILHAHPSAVALPDFLMKYTYDPMTWIYVISNNEKLLYGTLAFSEQSPGFGWEKVIEVRAQSDDTTKFNHDLLGILTLGAEDYGHGDIWDEFENNFRRRSRILDHPKVLNDYHYTTLHEIASQNVQFAEMHTYVGNFKNGHGVIMSGEEIIKDWLRALDKVHKDYPDFGLRLIAARGRAASAESTLDYWKQVADLRKKYPDTLMGIDLVMEEDKTHTNLYFVDAFLEAVKYAEEQGTNLPVYVHSGESNRLDNDNLYDVILWGAKRIGHGFALPRHPELLRLVKERDICIEVCPISNQALNYVTDLRNHPAVTFLVRGVPFIISPDDQGLMRYRYSYDWLVATLGWDLSIGEMKNLILNSYRYSGMNEKEREIAMKSWQTKWDTFIDWFLQADIQPPKLDFEEDDSERIGGYGK